MANEILKDEIMNDAELDNVAGGTRNELALDTQLFNAMGGRCKAYDVDEITNTNVRGIAGKVDDLWASFGIKVEYNDAGKNSYIVNGRRASRREAINEALHFGGYNYINPKEFYI